MKTAENLQQALKENLHPQLLEILLLAQELAAGLNLPIYLVGGTVRDIILSRPVLDLDLTVEGDSEKLAEVLSRELKTEAVIHRAFGTATIKVNGFCIDLAAARKEKYPEPAALPMVEPGTIAEDLKRRDFSINAIAARLYGAAWGTLIDPLGGLGDLELRLLRVINDHSFINDPTRILRALRYKARLGFQLEHETEALLIRDTVYLGRLSGERLWKELELILQEGEPEKALMDAQRLGVSRYIAPGLRIRAETAKLFAKARNSSFPHRPSPAFYLCLLAFNMRISEVEELYRRLRLWGPEAKALQGLITLKERWEELAKPDVPQSIIYSLLNGIPEEVLQGAALSAPPETLHRQHLRFYLESLRSIKPFLKGSDLKALGVPSGPLLGDMLKKLLEAKLDGEIQTRYDEENLVRQWLSKVNNGTG